MIRYPSPEIWARLSEAAIVAAQRFRDKPPRKGNVIRIKGLTLRFDGQRWVQEAPSKAEGEDEGEGEGEP